LSITDDFHVVPKKPNLQVAEGDYGDIFNFHFPGDAEGSESFDRILHVIQQIKAGQVTSLVPLAEVSEVRPPLTARDRSVSMSVV
jgi:hypothetical protein